MPGDGTVVGYSPSAGPPAIRASEQVVWNRVKLRAQFGLVLVVLAVVLSGIVFTGFQMNKQSVADQQTASVSHASEEVANDLNTRIAGLKRTVRLRSTNPAITAHGEPRQHRALQATVDESAFSGVSVIHRNGTMTGIAAGLDAETRDRLVGSDFSNRRYFQRAVRGETYVSTPVVAESGHHIVTFSTPIYRNGTVVATLNAALHLEDSSFLRNATYAVDGYQGVTVRSRAEEVIYERRPEPTTNLIVASATVAETGWTVSVQASRDVLADDLRLVTLYQFGAVGLALLLVGGLGVLLYTRTLSYHERLLDGFDRLSGGDYGYELDTDATEDWKRILSGFNDMSRTLAAYEREQTEQNEQLQRERDRFRALFQGIPEPVVIVEFTGDGTILKDANEAFETTFGYEIEETSGEDLNDLIVPESELAEARAIDELASAGGQATEEVRRETVDGVRDFLFRSTPLVHEDDTDQQFGVYVDITERKAQERALRALTERLDMALEGGRLGVWDWNVQTDAVTYDERWAEMLGYDLDDIDNQLSAWENRIHPDDRADVDAALDAHMDGETEYYECDHRLRTKAGDWIWIRDVGRVVERSDDGEPLRAVGIHQDITKQKSRERTLRETLEGTRTLIQAETATEAAEIAVDIAANALSFPVSGVHLDESRRRPDPTASGDGAGERIGFVPSGEAGGDHAVHEIVRDAYASGETRVVCDVGETYPEIAAEASVESVLVHPLSAHGVFVTAARSAAAFDEFDRNLAELLAAILTATLDRLHREQRIEAQRDNLDLLNQIVRHDIRNDLQILLARLDILADRVDEGELEHVEIALKSAESAVELTRTARDMSDVMLQSETDSHPVSLRGVIDRQLDEFRSTEPQAQLSVDGPLPPVTVAANEMIDSVVRNLLKNAVQHTDKETPEVTVSAEERADSVVLRVADNGPGVPEEVRDSIFGKGQKGLDSKGTGIGLYLVYALVDGYGGDVWVEDNEPEGAVFAVELPKASA